MFIAKKSPYYLASQDQSRIARLSERYYLASAWDADAWTQKNAIWICRCSQNPQKSPTNFEVQIQSNMKLFFSAQQT